MKFTMIAAALFLTSACATTLQTLPPVERVDETAAIRNVLTTQKNAWNVGSIDGFMDGYWRSPNLRFASGDKVTNGWQETLERYRTNYADRSKMGMLDFTDIEVDQLSEDAAIVHGRWQLTRAGDKPHGLFTLVFRKIDGRWFIASDTTTSGGS